MKKNVSLKLSDGDVRGAIRLLSSSNEIASDSPEVIAALRAKHPSPPLKLEMPLEPDSSTKPWVSTDSEVVAAMSSFNTGSGAGLDGLRPAHLKDLICRTTGEAGIRLVTELRKLVNVALQGKIPHGVRASFFSGSLTALKKSRRRNSTYCCRYHVQKIGDKGSTTFTQFGTRRNFAASAARVWYLWRMRSCHARHTPVCERTRRRPNYSQDRHA